MKESNKIGELVNKLFNTNPDEQVVKLLSEEIKIPEGNIAEHLTPDMKNVMKGIEKLERTKLIDAMFNTKPDENVVKSLIGELKFPDVEKETQENVEDTLVIDDQELVQYISDKLTKQGIMIIEEDILRILDLEVEYLKLKGVITDDSEGEM